MTVFDLKTTYKEPNKTTKKRTIFEPKYVSLNFQTCTGNPEKKQSGQSTRLIKKGIAINF